MTNPDIIDAATFEALKEAMGADFLVELAQTYFEETPQLLAKLKQSLAGNDCDGFRTAAHSIKSTSRSFGAMNLGEQALELEQMGRAANLAGSSEKVAALETGYAAVRQALEGLVHG